MKDSHIDGPILKSVCSYSNKVLTRADTLQPGTKDVFASALGTRETSSSYRISVAPSSASAIKVLDNPFVSLSKSLDESEVDALLSVKIKNLNNLIVRINRVNKADVVKEAES